MNPHLVLLPILIPLTGAAVGLLIWQYPRVQRAWSAGALLTSFVASIALLWMVRDGGPVVFQVGGWPAPFGITMVGDLLSRDACRDGAGGAGYGHDLRVGLPG